MWLFNDISLRNLKGDMFGGVTAAVIALPMALAFGVASGAGAEAGLYGAILVGIFAALFGGTPTLISEPTGPMTVVFTAVIAKLIASDPVNGMAMAFTVVIMAGLFQILFGVLKLGKFVTLMPYTVISGFMSGIGIILIILQVAPLLGNASPAGGVIAILQNIPEIIAATSYDEMTLAIITVAILFLLPASVKRYIPPQLVALIFCTLISIVFMSMDDIRRIGAIPTGLPDIQIPVFSADQWQEMFVDAVVLGLLGCIDALLTSVVSDSLTKQEHNSDKELVGQGIGNVMSGLFGGLPGAGATMGTVVNIQAGARSALSGIIRATILLIIVLWAAGLTSVIPLSVLSAIALKVGIDIIDWKFLKRAHRISSKGAAVTYSVIILTVFVDLIVAVGIGLFVANVMTVTRLSALQAEDVKTFTNSDECDTELTDREMELLDAAKGRVIVMHLQGTMIFGASREIARKNTVSSDIRTLIVDLNKVSHLGVSSALALEGTIKESLSANNSVYIVGDESKQPVRRLETLGLLKNIPSSNVVSLLGEALENEALNWEGENNDRNISFAAKSAKNDEEVSG